MKQKLFLILSFLMISNSALAQDCSMSLFPMDFEALIKSDCMKFGNRRTCNCLREEAARGKNVLITEAFKSSSDVQKKIDDNRAIYTKRFMSVYSQMTVESSAQMMIMGLADNGVAIKNSVNNISGQKEVGCSPDQISKKVNERFDTFSNDQLPKLDKLLKQAREAKEDCLNPSLTRKILAKNTTRACDQYDERINELLGAKEKLNNPKSAACYAGLSLLGTQRRQLENAIKYYASLVADSQNETERKQRLKDIRDLNLTLKYIEDRYKVSGAFVGAVNIAASTFGQGVSLIKTTNGGFLGLSDVELCNNIVKFAQKKLSDMDRDLASEGGEVIKQEQCSSPDDAICNGFAGKNAELEKSLKDQFAHDPKTSCLSFAEFKTFKSMPDQELLNAFEGASEKKMRSLLHAPSSADDELSKAQTRFLRSNPIISKLAASDDKSLQDIGGKLKQLSIGLKGISDPGKRLAAYLKFMKNDIGPVVRKSGDQTELYICDMMVDNFAAIQVANDIPSFKDAEKQEELFSKIRECKEKTYNKTTTTNLSTTLKTSPIFTLGADDAALSNKEEQKQFDELKRTVCANYENEIKNCKDGNIENCRLAFLNKSEVAGRSQALTDHEISRSISQGQMARIMSKTDVNAQDNNYKADYEKEIGSKLSHNFIAGKGQESSYAHSQQADQKVASSVKLPERINGATSSAPSAVASSESAPAVNPSQDVPSFVNQPVSQPTPSAAAAAPVRAPASEAPVSFDAKEVQQAKSIQDVIPQYDQSSPENKVKYLDELKNFVASQPNKEELEDKFDLEQEKREKLKEQKAIAEAKIKQIADNTAVAKPVFQAPSFASNSNVVGLYPTLPQPSSSGSAFSSTSQARISAPAKGYGAVNDVLNEINAKKASGELQIVIQSSVANSSGVPTPFIVTDRNTLVADNEAAYKDLIANPDKLAQFLAGKVDVTKLKDAELISVKDPSSDHHMMFKVVKGKSNTLMFESWPTNVSVQVARSQKLDDLRLNLAR